MKKLFVFIFIVGCIVTSGYTQSIHNISFTNIDGAAVSLSSFSGKRLLFILSPQHEADSGQFKNLKDFQRVHGDSVVLIGIMSVEDGFSPSMKSAVKALYAQNEIKILLTEGMQTRRTAGSSQSQLMEWLTHKNLNYRFDTDALGVCQKFFISPSGRFNGMLPPNVPFLDPLVWRLLYKE